MCKKNKLEFYKQLNIIIRFREQDPSVGSTRHIRSATMYRSVRQRHLRSADGSTVAIQSTTAVFITVGG